MFTNVEATPLSGKRFVGKRLGISRQITRQTASLLQGCEAVIFEAERGDPDKGLGLVLWNYKLETAHVSKKNYESFKGAIFFANMYFLFSGNCFERTRYFVVSLMFNKDVALTLTVEDL